jgi:uncharacterized protein (DUF305 family)
MLKTISLAGLAIALTTLIAHADEVGLPEICKATTPMQMEKPMAMDMGGSIDDAHKALMAGMDTMNKDMDQGMQAKDIDVAFICGMLPHHQGAIEMAKTELQYGDDPWAKQLAQAIIEAQTKEIAEMKDWLAKQPK